MNTNILNSDPLSDAVAVKTKHFISPIIAADTPAPITADLTLWFSELWVYAYKALDNGVPVQNTSDIWIGEKSVVLKNGFSDLIEIATTGDTAARGTYAWNGVQYVQYTDATYVVTYNSTTSKWNLKHNATVLATADTLTGTWTNTASGTDPAPVIAESFPTPDLLQTGGSPLTYLLRPNHRMRVADIVFQGPTIGDGVYCKYR